VTGPENMEQKERHDLRTAASYTAGLCRVMFVRPLQDAGTNDTVFEPGKFTPFAVTLYDGRNGEENKKGAISAWYYLVPEPPTPARVHVFPVVAGIVFLGLGLLLHKGRQEKRTGEVTFHMFKKIFIPIDNSKYSRFCTLIGTALAGQFGSELTGCHVYSANLHDKRFRDMEVGLPGHFREEERLKKSRKVHASLIGDGLRLISDAYLETFKQECLNSAVPFNCKMMEGKNWLELVKDVRSSGYDLVVLGILGLGAMNGNLIGSVCERVARKVDADVLVVKNDAPLAGRIVTVIDGSDHSYAAFRKALILGKRCNLKIEVVSAYDPYFHRRAFQALVGVLSDEAGKMFKFKDQEKLHDEVIDDGLGKIYRNYLERAVRMGHDEDIEVKSTLLAGKAYDEINKYLAKEPPSLLVVGRFGAQKTEEQDIGSTAENLLRLAPCNVLITGNQ